MNTNDILHYELIRTTCRLTFDVLWQREDTIYRGDDDGDYFIFVASNGYQVISRSRMDIQTERLWLWGAKANERRSGSMIFSSDEKRDRAYHAFDKALDEWFECVRAGRFGPKPAGSGFVLAQFLGNDDHPKVDQRPQAYKRCMFEGDPHLRRVTRLVGGDAILGGEPLPLSDFARISDELTTENIATFLAWRQPAICSGEDD